MGAEKLQYVLSAKVQDHANNVRNFYHDHKVISSLTMDIYMSIKVIWTDSTIQEVYTRKDEFVLMDSAQYFFKSIERIADPNYIPATKDILCSRFKHKHFIIYDVGGQKSQRRKWLHLFDNITALLYVSAISEYDQMLEEDPETNRLHDALTLFKSIANHEVFRTIPVIVFLNKKDVFEKKIKRVPLTRCWPNYKYRNDYKNTIKYIIRKFEKQIVDKAKSIYPHLTCAVDTNHMEMIMDSVSNMIIESNFIQTGVYQE